MKIFRIIGNEGRITIPYAIRQAVGFLPDDVVSFPCTMLPAGISMPISSYVHPIRALSA